MKDENTAIDSFMHRQRTGRGPVLIFATLLLIMFGGFSFLYIRLATAFETRPRFTTLADPTTLLITKEQGFIEAKAHHTAQAERAAQTIFNRGPKGLDSPERASRLLGRTAHQQLLKMVEEQAAEFDAKNLRQKIEIASVNLIRLQNRSVRTSVYGQLIRTGSFEGQPINEASNVMITMLFVHNPSLLENGLFPTVVTEFEVTTEPITAQ